MLALVRPSANNIFHCQNPKDFKLITKLRLQLAHLRLHKFRGSFQNTLNSIYNCGIVETSVHYLLHCPNFSNKRLTLFNKIQSIGENILSKGDPTFQKCFSLAMTHLMM